MPLIGCIDLLLADVKQAEARFRSSTDFALIMKDKYKNLPLSSGVGIVVLNEKNQVFLAKRIDNPKNFWQMPQGGVDKGEKYYNAALRELKEETSIQTVSLIKEIDGLTTYF